jgi:hypothetical protein
VTSDRPDWAAEDWLREAAFFRPAFGQDCYRDTLGAMSFRRKAQTDPAARSTLAE